VKLPHVASRQFFFVFLPFDSVANSLFIYFIMPAVL
jgi:hypothetical protein